MEVTWWVRVLLAASTVAAAMLTGLEPPTTIYCCVGAGDGCGLLVGAGAASTVAAAVLTGATSLLLQIDSLR
jgi:hypothetical protein